MPCVKNVRQNSQGFGANPRCPSRLNNMNFHPTRSYRPGSVFSEPGQCCIVTRLNSIAACLPAPILCLHKPLVAFLEKKRFLSVHDHGVPDPTAADLCGSGTAFVLELLNDEDSPVFPTNCPGKEVSVFIHIQIDSNIRFPAL